MTSANSSSTTLILRNGTVLTMDPERPRAEAVAIAHGRIAAVCDEADIGAFRTPGTCELDMKGGTLVPGFIDSHLHLVAGARSLVELRLENLHSPHELLTLLRNASQGKTPGDWIIGHGWEDATVRGDAPNRLMLDAVPSENPVFLTRRDGHAAWLNTRAIEALGIDLMRSPVEEEIPRAADGFPLGVLYEDAMTQAAKKLRSVLPHSQLKRAVLKAIQGLASSGVTTAHDIATTYPHDFLMYRKLAHEGELKVRVISSPLGCDRFSALTFTVLRALSCQALKVGPRKYYLDGSFGARTALLREPYADDPSGSNTGLSTLSTRQLQDTFNWSHIRRTPIVLHAIGDEAAERVVCAAERTRARYGDRGVRNRIEHIQVIDPRLIPRFRDVGLIASFQPVFLYEYEMTLKRLGERRLRHCYLLRDFWDAGIPIILSSDWPYGGGDYPRKPDGSRLQAFEPILGIHAAVDRLGFNAGQRLSVSEALCAYTRNAAWAHGEEAFKGTISTGKLADLALLSQDITVVPAPEILNTEVLMTVVGGKLVHRA